MAIMRLTTFAYWMLFTTAVASLSVEELDTREGSDVTLRCRFQPTQSAEPLTYYWVRTTSNTHDNVAIGDIPLQFNYQIQYKPREGVYDLQISNATYDGENGRFECRIKAGGSGRVVHSQQYSLVVLIPPTAPTVTPGTHAHAQEAHDLQLACATSGGSPVPTVKWYREGSPYPLEANITTNKQRTDSTVATLTLSPTKDEDGAVYRCVVWNRAMPEGQQLEATVDLSVSYFPRVKVGPQNPLRVEIDEDATLECMVDAKPKANNVRWTKNGKFVSNSLTYTIQRVTMEDAGQYICIAENGLDHPGEGELYVDVLYPPTVTVRSKTYETEEGGKVEIRCDISANPEPVTIEWSMEGKPDFRQKSDTLLLTNVKAEQSGTYTCRAVNVISTSSGKRTERAGSASVAVLIRHKPGRAVITPEKPVVQEGASVTLTCSASPPGWPEPIFRWFRNIVSFDAEQVVIATGNKYTIPSAHLGSEGAYYCQATNELGHGDMVSVNLEVHQPPRFQTKLQPHVKKGTEETDFAVTCSAVGKPRPTVIWVKDNVEIKPDGNLYQVKNDVSEGTNSNYNVQSTLRFSGNSRPGSNRLMPEDRGIYSCIFENEVKKVESTMHLRIEHEPIAIRQKHKVAYDQSESAEISCRVLAYPKPEFQWYFGANTAPIEPSTESRYDITTTTNNNDSYLSVLKIRNIRSQDYGDYYCKVKNSFGTIKPQIRLQPKGAPESPKTLVAKNIGSSFVTLNWDAGFDGGLSSTKYFISYKRLARNAASSGGGSQCSSEKMYDSDWMEYDCGRLNPCNVTMLDQNDSYLFKVKAVNTKGQSNYSNEISATTKVDLIPAPEQVTFEPVSRSVAFSVAPTCLSLVGVAEVLRGSQWVVADTVTLALAGDAPSFQEAVIEIPQALTKPSRGSARTFGEPVVDEFNPRLRLKLCLRTSQDMCSEYTEAEIGPSYIKEASAVTTATVVAIVVSGLVFLVFLSLLFVFCRCKKNVANKDTAKDYEMDAMRPAMVSQNQAPPPYYPSSGMENKALEHSMDLALAMEDSKSAVYGTQSGYGYHVPPQQHPSQNMSNADWVNMGYMDNNYANSNNGGSVNSQDSLWQMKMAANNGMPPQDVRMLDRQSNYGYDPMAHGGYGTIDDYAPYPHLAQPPVNDAYNRGSANPSRQEYCSDPYASVHKPKKRMDQHIESPYHEVSGLPEGFPAEGAEDKPLAHLSLSYDESLESGYSTPNSRARRVIREIIV